MKCKIERKCIIYYIKDTSHHTNQITKKGRSVKENNPEKLCTAF